MTVATSVFFASCPSSSMRLAHIAMTTSAVDDLALLVDHDESVGVAVERDAHLRAALHDLRADVVGRERARILVDVRAGRLVADRGDVRAELAEDERGHLCRRRRARHRRPRARCRARARAGRSPWRRRCSGRPRRRGGRPCRCPVPVGRGPSSASLPIRRSISASTSSASLKPSEPKNLDAVVLIRIVARADDDAGVRTHAHGELCHRGGWGAVRTG